MAKRALLLAYAGCSTCKRAISWLAAHNIAVDVRAIVDGPPTAAELAAWLPRSGLPPRKWLNTSGQSYKALGGKAAFDAMTDAQITSHLTRDGKLVKRPVLIHGTSVLVGFNEAAYAALLGK